MVTVKLILEYDGTHYHGWERQPCLITLQGTLEAALRQLTGRATLTFGSGRTDAGVHAKGQVVHFTTTASFQPEEWIRALNALLPRDMAVQSAQEVSPSFHARYAAQGKTYVYRIHLKKIRSPLSVNHAWHIPYALDIKKMRMAAKHLIGHHNFAAFCGKAKEREKHTVDLREIQITKKGVEVEIRITASHFLRYMVRNIVGLLVEVGRGRRSPHDVPVILAGRDRRLSGPTAPPHGLFLIHVEYPDNLGD